MHRNPARSQDRPRHAYFPFGAGPRVCIGKAFARMELLLALAAILPRFRFELAPGQSVVPEPGITLHPRGGLRMLVTPAAS